MQQEDLRKDQELVDKYSLLLLNLYSLLLTLLFPLNHFRNFIQIIQKLAATKWITELYKVVSMQRS